MAEDDDLLQKADALMRRHRVFVAGAAAQDEPVADAEDVPVLTEVVDPDNAIVATLLAPVDATATLRQTLSYEIESWLDAELPQHIAHVLDGITDQLIGQLSVKARSELLPRLLNALEAPPAAVKPPSGDD